MMTTTTQKPDITHAQSLLWFAGLIAAGLIYHATHMITTDIGFETVLVHQPVLGDYEVLPKTEKPGRSLEWFTVRGITVKTDKMHFYERYTDYSPRSRGEDTIQVELIAKSKDSVALVSQFGEFWYTDHVKDILLQSVADVAREYSNEVRADSKVFQKDFNGRLRAVVQMKFKSNGVPLIVQSVSGEFSKYPESSSRRYSFHTNPKTVGQGIRVEY